MSKYAKLFQFVTLENVLSIPNIIRLSTKNMQIGTYKFAP